MSSGNRVLRLVLLGSGLEVYVDHTHGTEDLPPEWRDSFIVLVFRNRQATDASREAGWGGDPMEVSYPDSVIGITERYQNADLAVTYEELCNRPEDIILSVANLLGIPPWTNEGPPTINQNEKWLSGEGGPQIGQGTGRN